MKLQEQVKLKGRLKLDFYNVVTKKHDIVEVDNMVVTLAKNSIADRLKGTSTNNKGSITYCALGTGTTAPDLTDTTLETEIDRKQISVRSVSGNVATFETYFTTSEAVGTLREAGLFGDAASDTADSGTLYARTAINRTKTANDTLTLTWTVTVG